MEGGEGDLVAAAIMAMQTDADQGEESTILQVVTKAEYAEENQVESQLMVHSDGGIIVQQHTSAALQNLQVQELQQHVHVQAPCEQQQGDETVVITGPTGSMDTVPMGVAIQEVSVIGMPMAQSSCGEKHQPDVAMQQELAERFLHVNFVC